MATCPKCNKTIDDDSYFCEHCGEKLYACPQCHTIGKGAGKRCGHCGSLLVEASAVAGQPTANAPQQSNPQPVQPQPVYQQPAQPQPVYQQPQPQPVYQQPQPAFQQSQPAYGQPAFQQSQPPQGTAVSPPQQASAIFCPAMQTRLQLIDGALIGREQGQYASQLFTFQYISSRHAQLNLTPSGWVLTDLGSRNGTAINGMPCMPNQGYPIHSGDIIRFARFYDFKVE